jgi:hypothetical protein
VCLYTPDQANYGNLGYCTPLCDCNDDCPTNLVCHAFATVDAEGNPLATQSELGHVGMCVAAGAEAGVACAR